MADEIHELAVRLRPEGQDETVAALEQTQESFERTADSVGETSGLMNDMGKRLKGSTAVVLAGLGTVAAGLLSQVPVIGEAMSGLDAILTAIQLRIDENLRPALSGLTNELFEIGDEIEKAEGPLGTFIDFLTLFTATALAGVAVAGLLAAGIVGVSAVTGVLGTTLGVLLGVIGLIAAVVAGFVIAWRNNWFNIRGITMSVIDSLDSLITGFIEFMTPFLNQFLSNVLEGNWIEAWMTLLRVNVAVFEAILAALAPFIAGFIGAVADFWNTVIAGFEKMWARIRTGFEVLWDIVVNLAKAGMNGILSTVESTVNKAIAALNRIPGVDLSGVSLPRFETRTAGEIAAAGRRRLSRRDRRISRREQERAGRIDDQVAQIVQALQNTDIETQLNLDGREVAKNQERILGGGAAATGRVARFRK